MSIEITITTIILIRIRNFRLIRIVFKVNYSLCLKRKG